MVVVTVFFEAIFPFGAVHNGSVDWVLVVSRIVYRSFDLSLRLFEVDNGALLAWLSIEMLSLGMVERGDYEEVLKKEIWV